MLKHWPYNLSWQVWCCFILLTINDGFGTIKWICLWFDDNGEILTIWLLLNEMTVYLEVMIPWQNSDFRGPIEWKQQKWWYLFWLNGNVVILTVWSKYVVLANFFGLWHDFHAIQFLFMIVPCFTYAIWYVILSDFVE